MALGKFTRSTALARITLLAAMGSFSGAAIAEEVSLKSADGTVNLTGEFVDFVDDNYIIRTALGELRISAARVRCEGAACPVFNTADADIRISGSDTFGVGLMPLMLTGYAASMDAEASIKATEREGEILATMVGDGGFGDEMGSILVSSSSSSGAFSELLDTSSVLAMAARRITPSEARALKAAGAGNMVSPSQEHVIAVDSVVVITHPDNPVRSITAEQLAAIYSGQIKTWSELGGPDLEINVINRDPSSGTHATFFSSVFGDAENSPQIGEIAPDNNSMAQMVNADPAAIGFTGYAF